MQKQCCMPFWMAVFLIGLRRVVRHAGGWKSWRMDPLDNMPKAPTCIGFSGSLSCFSICTHTWFGKTTFYFLCRFLYSFSRIPRHFYCRYRYMMIHDCTRSWTLLTSWRNNRGRICVEGVGDAWTKHVEEYQIQDTKVTTIHWLLQSSSFNVSSSPRRHREVMLGYRYHHVESTCTIHHTAHAPVVATLRVVLVPSRKRTQIRSASSFGPRCAVVFLLWDWNGGLAAWNPNNSLSPYQGKSSQY